MRLTLMLLLLIVPLCALPGLTAKKNTPPPTTATTPAEAELGKRTAEQIEKEFKLVKDEKTIARLNAMAAEIAPVTQRPDVVYTCKILDTPALNAMAIPGGTIYFTQGLLNAVESDDELAGVMAHEIAHNSLRHARKLVERETSASMMQLATLFATIYLNRGDTVDAGQLLMMSELVKQALVNGYTITLEEEADANGVEYLHKTKKYNPVGLYSVILGFRQIESHQPTMTLGYLKTHPYSEERRQQIEKKLKDMKVPINLWAVVNFRASVIPPKDDAVPKTYMLHMSDVDIFPYQVTVDDKDPSVRAQEAAAAINRRLVKDDIKQFDVTSDVQDGVCTIQLRGNPVMTLTEADAAAAGITLNALGVRVVKSIQLSIWHETVKRS